MFTILALSAIRSIHEVQSISTPSRSVRKRKSANRQWRDQSFIVFHQLLKKSQCHIAAVPLFVTRCPNNEYLKWPISMYNWEIIRLASSVQTSWIWEADWKTPSSVNSSTSSSAAICSIVSERYQRLRLSHGQCAQACRAAGCQQHLHVWHPASHAWSFLDANIGASMIQSNISNSQCLAI